MTTSDTGLVIGDLGRWPGYGEQSWAERFAELDRQFDETVARFVQHAEAHAEFAAEKAKCIAELEGALEELRTAGHALVEKTDAMIEATNPIFAEMQLVRGRGAYSGPQIGEELEAFRKALGAG